MMKARYLCLSWAFLALMVSCRNNKVGEAQETASQTSNTFLQTRTAEAKKPDVQKVKAITFYEQPAPLTDRPEQILKRKGYTTSYNNKSKNPNWVAWHLTKAHT